MINDHNIVGENLMKYSGKCTCGNMITQTTGWIGKRITTKCRVCGKNVICRRVKSETA